MSSGRTTENGFFFEMNNGGRTGMSFLLSYDEEHNMIKVRMSAVDVGSAPELCSTRTNIDFQISPERAMILFNPGFWDKEIPQVLERIKAKVDAKNE